MIILLFMSKKLSTFYKRKIMDNIFCPLRGHYMTAKSKQNTNKIQTNHYELICDLKSVVALL